MSRGYFFRLRIYYYYYVMFFLLYARNKLQVRFRTKHYFQTSSVYIHIYIYTSTVTHTVFILHAYFNSNTILKQTSVVFLKTIYLPRRCISKPIIRTHSDIFDLEIFSEYLMIVAILHLYFSIVATDSFNHSRFSNLLTSNIIH